MISKTVVLIVFTFYLDRVLTQKPPKVPQLFLSEPSKQTPADLPLTLQAIQTALPNTKTNSCYETLSNILQILANREQTTNAGVQTLLPVIEKLKEIKNDDSNDDSIKKAIDITSDAMRDLLEKNYQYQNIGTNLYNIGTLRKTSAPAKTFANPVKITTLPENSVQVFVAPNAYQTPPKAYQLPSNAHLPRNQLPSIYQPANVCPVASSRGLASNVVAPCQRQTLDRNVWPVVPVTKINGCLNDDDAVVVVYKPKVLSVSNSYGNVLKTSSKMLVPYYVSKLNR